MTKQWHVSASRRSLATLNPIRETVGRIGTQPNPEKTLIPLSLGDPTASGNFPTHPSVVDAVVDVVKQGQHNGYFSELGLNESRQAVAGLYTSPSCPVTKDDVVLASGCSHALQLVIGALGNEGDNLLVPAPSFPLYSTLANYNGVETRQYNLLSEKNWECDLAHLESLIDERTVAILVNNPSNPCGSVFSKDHVMAILHIAEKHCLPIISDEIYRELCFDGCEFEGFAENTQTVPVIAVGGIAKRFLVPGWRLGWIIIHDRSDILTKGQVRAGINRLATHIVGPNSLMQAALPRMLTDPPQEFFEHTRKTLETNALYCKKRIDELAPLETSVPQGAFYMMIRIRYEMFEDIPDDMTFTKKLLSEESVFVLPGSCFAIPTHVRIVVCLAQEKLAEAFDRITEFCARHAKKN
eukprot:TRINITY_DN15032_c0_g1::TRINITY_DN15032_c0_g1_i1::g.24936::m.24936 TRINITY_DN15032_c0_g1::TRINITY_DN15032_c0_g1_i1::g.24936  ORF type:complete len:430 (-),score=80.81,sp/Q8QZR1/ATTY_MOUSE/45.76/9e-136,Aminotran_1_2/PF00155.16/9.8e-68,DegT_DnrJ_EryC1/PF01041.12/3.3e-06,Beta_elim_lyase/PF01212.16/9.8e-05,Aminotran_5/PF00266.14/0.0004,Cys_Met_Meta_PP/PF01053.15/0.0034 TRINITY_DN15032_c0_g1_i1:396-1628(-)